MARRVPVAVRLLAIFEAWSTSAKIMTIMTAALLPFGIIALIAAIHSNRSLDAAAQADMRVALSEATRKLDAAITTDIALAKSASVATATPEGARIACFRIDAMMDDQQGRQPEYAVFGPDRTLACATAGFAPLPPVTAPMAPVVVQASLAADALKIAIADPNGRGSAVLRYPTGVLVELIRPIGLVGPSRVALGSVNQEVVLAAGDSSGRELDTVSAPLSSIGMSLTIASPKPQVSFTEALQAFLPLLMWAAASVMAFLVADRLLIRPLHDLRRAVAELAPGERLSLPQRRTPAREIGALAATFDAAMETIAAHESRIAEALEAQVKLTRDVHHRVKNNLQIIASLISLHARGAAAGPASDAYAAIQRRVDALAIVHRHNFSEFETGYGVRANALIAELAANFRTGLAASGVAPTIRTTLSPLRVAQDAAVPIAYLITEIADLSIRRDRTAPISIGFVPAADGIACLTIGSPMLAQAADGDSARIIEGLARQLRSPLRHDPQDACYAIDVAANPETVSIE